MDVHSRHLQYNRREPRTGPATVVHRSMDQMASIQAAATILRPNTTILKTKLNGEFLINNKTSSKPQKDEKLRKDMHMAFVNNAITQRYMGNSEPFQELLSQFDLRSNQSSSTSVSQLRLWISALSHVVSRLDASYSALVDAVLKVPWSTLDDGFVKTYIEFVGMLVSARPEYLSTTLDTCVQGLTYEFNFKEQAFKLAESSSNLVTRGTVYDRHHALLQHLLNLIPTLPSTIQPILIQYFPHKRLSKSCQITYIRNLLRIITYCPSLSPRILSIVIERAIKIDVEIQIEINDLEEAEQNAGHQAGEMFELDPFDTNPTAREDMSDEESESGDEDELDALSDISSEGNDLDDLPSVVKQEIDYPHIRDMVDKLDAIMKILFEHFARKEFVRIVPPNHGSQSPSLQQELYSMTPEERQEYQATQFYTLLSVFDHIVLRTLKSKHTQFLLFWYTSLDPQYLDVFQGMLISKAFLEQDVPTVIKVASLSYIASFVSRALFVDRKHTRHIVKLLGQHLDDRLEESESEDSPRLNATQYTTFYAVAQALFLIFCFRWRDLIDDDDDDADDFVGVGASGVQKRKWIPELQCLPKAVASPLNPLKICSSHVVEQFASVAHKSGFLYVFPIIEANKRAEYQGSNSTSAFLVVGDGTLSTNLNTFFPFDPYDLQSSKEWISGIYRDWASVAIEDGVDEDDETAEGSDCGSESGPVGRQDITAGLGVSFEAMSISPVRPQVAMMAMTPVS